MLGPARLRLLGGLGTLVVCGASGAVVALDTKPQAAPLKPPADPGRPAGQAAQAGGGPGTLDVPLSTCGGQGQGAPRGGGSGGGAAAAPTAPPGTDPAVAGALRQLATARTAQQRQAILAALTPDQRQQVTALLARPRGGPGGGGAGACTAGPQSQQSGGPGVIAPDQVQGGPVQTPVVDTYVS